MSAPADWWRNFFSGFPVELWLRVPTAEMNSQEADFLQQALGVDPPARLLDVPCGGGRHSLALAGRGYHLTGVDISEEFLAAARAQAPPAAGSVAWEQREMRDLPWQGHFDGAFSFGNSFAYLDEQGNADFLSAVARALKPGACFALDTSYVMEVILPTLQERAWMPVGDDVILFERRYDPASSRLEVEYTLVRGGKTEKRSMSARLYAYREVVGLMGQAGFTDVQGYGSLAREPFKLGAQRLLVVGTRKVG
jgi:SAM-dependent methyltransferase